MTLQEAVYERLLQWVQTQCQSLSKDANDIESTEHEIQPLLRAALRVLLGRPSYYRCVTSALWLYFVSLPCFGYVFVLP